MVTTHYFHQLPQFEKVRNIYYYFDSLDCVNKIEFMGMPTKRGDDYNEEFLQDVEYQLNFYNNLFNLNIQMEKYNSINYIDNFSYGSEVKDDIIYIYGARSWQDDLYRIPLLTIKYVV